jgi:hypothetical protein
MIFRSQSEPVTYRSGYGDPFATEVFQAEKRFERRVLCIVDDDRVGIACGSSQWLDKTPN